MSADMEDAVSAGSRAIVVFSGATDLKILRCLKPGFRHCCMVIEAGRYWVFVDPSSRGVALSVFRHLSLPDIVAWFQSQNATVVCCRARGLPLEKTPLRLMTCVEAVKRTLGLRAPFVLTPWQLFWHLTMKGT